MTAENIANFMGQNAFTAEKMIMTDFCDSLICKSIYGGFLMSCPDQDLCKQIIPQLATIQQGENDPKEFPEDLRDKLLSSYRMNEAEKITKTKRELTEEERTLLKTEIQNLAVQCE